MDENERLQKANENVEPITTGILAGGGRLNTAQANTFIDKTVDFSVLLKMCRVLRVTNPMGEFYKLLFGDVVTEVASENADSGNIYKPTHSKVEYATKKLRSAMDLTTEQLEENVEGAGYQDTVVNSLSKRISTDLELLSILGDATTYADSTTNTGRLLKHSDGWYVQGLEGHTVDCAGGYITKSVLSKMIRALPDQYKMQYDQLRFLVSPSILQDMRDTLANRLTLLGDQSLTDNQPLRIFGIPLLPVPLIPSNLDSLDGSDEWGDASFMWLTIPNNFIHVISRDMDMYWQYWPRKDAREYTVYTRVDNIIEETDAMVTGYDVRVAGADAIDALE